jgi:hypothetical protein
VLPQRIVFFNLTFECVAIINTFNDRISGLRSIERIIVKSTTPHIYFSGCMILKNNSLNTGVISECTVFNKNVAIVSYGSTGTVRCIGLEKAIDERSAVCG